MSAAIEFARLALAAVMLAGGVGFMALAALGVARLPEPMSRLHAVTKAETAGLGLFLIGLVLCAPGWRLGLIAFGAWAALAVSAASASHFIGGRLIREPDGK